MGFFGQGECSLNGTSDSRAKVGSEAQSVPLATVAHQEVFSRWCLFSNPGGFRGIGLSRGIGRAPEWLAIPRTPCLV